MNRTLWIAALAAALALGAGCGKKEEAPVTTEVKEAAPVAQKETEAPTVTLEHTKEMAHEKFEETHEAAKEMHEAVKATAEEAAKAPQASMEHAREMAHETHEAAKEMHEAVKTEAVAALKIDLEMGGQVYAGSCVACHGRGLAGAPKTGDKEAWVPRIETGMEAMVKNAIEGYRGPQGIMPARGGNANLSDAEVRAAVQYMVEESK